VTTVPVLVINGAIGSGKSTVLGEVSDLLIEVETPHTALDLDCLSQTFPRQPDDEFMMRLAIENLAGVWSNARAAGSQRLVLASVIESGDGLDAMLGSIPNADPFVCRLSAPVSELIRRLDRREIGTSHDWHVRRAAELANLLAAGDVDDLVVETAGRTVLSIGLEILAVANWPHPPQ
jgi:hypothetical protein